MSVIYLLASDNTLIPLEQIQLQNTLLNMISSSQEYFLGQNRLYYYAVSDDVLLLLENTPLNHQIINNYTIHYDSTRLFSLKFTTRSGGATELGMQQVLQALGSSLTIVDLNQINALSYTTGNFSRGALLEGNDFNENEILLFKTNNKIKSSNRTLSEFVDTNNEQVIAAPKTFSSNVNLTFISTPAGNDTNNLLTRNQNNGRIQQAEASIDKLVLTDNEQNVSGNKTFTGNVKLQNLLTNTGTISKVLVRNQNTNLIEEANVSNVINSTSTASTITIDVVRENVFKLRDLTTHAAQPFPKNEYTTFIWDYLNATPALGGGSITSTTFGNEIALTETGLYEFDLSFGIINSPPTITATKNSGDILIELYIDNVLTDRKTQSARNDDFGIFSFSLYYRNLTNSTTKNASIKFYHTFTSSTTINVSPPLTYSDILLLGVAQTKLCVKNYGTQQKLLDIQHENVSTSSALFVKPDGTLIKNTNLTPDTMLDKATNQTITGVKTFQADDLVLNPITTAVATSNKLLTRKQANGVVEETNMTVSSVSTIDTNQTITGNKSFTGETSIENLFCSGLQAQYTLSCGGTVSWYSNRLKWNIRVICIPVERTEMGADGHFSIECPASGVAIKTYDGSNTGGSAGTTVNTNSDGILISDNSALWYILPRGGASASVSNNLVVANYLNTHWRPSSNWVLLAHTNSDGGSSKINWFPNKITIPPNHIYSNLSGFVGATANISLGANASMTIFTGVNGDVWYDVYVYPRGTDLNYESAVGRFTCFRAGAWNDNKSQVNTLSSAPSGFITPTITIDASNIYLTNPQSNNLFGRVLVKRLY